MLGILSLRRTEEDQPPARLDLQIAKTGASHYLLRLREDGVGGSVERPVLMLKCVKPSTAVAGDLTGPEGIEQGAGDKMSVAIIEYSLNGLAVQGVQEEFVHLTPRVV